MTTTGTGASGDADGTFRRLAADLKRIQADGDVRGCSEEQIAGVADTWGVPLPESYSAFLRVMGQEAGPLWRDSYHFVPKLLELDLAWLRELAGELGVVLPQGTMLPINGHDGYEFQWMLLENGHEKDPPVWQLLETQEPVLKLVAATYTQYVAEAMSTAVAFYLTHPNFDYWNGQWPGGAED